MLRRSPTLDQLQDPTAARGLAELIVDQEHLDRVVRGGILKAKVSLDIATADFKAMLVPEDAHQHGSARSIVARLADLAHRGVEIRVLHAGVPSAPALEELREVMPHRNYTVRRCPRLHAKAVVVDTAAMYLGSANLTGAGLGAKGKERRNIEWGVWTTAPGLIEGVLQQFNELWEGARCRPCGRRDICPVPLEEPRLR